MNPFARPLLKQIFCLHRRWIGVRWNVLEQGFRLSFRTEMCLRCGRHRRSV